jgi:hypothetical protein
MNRLATLMLTGMTLLSVATATWPQPIGTAQALERAKYPDWTGGWRRWAPPNAVREAGNGGANVTAGGQPSFDQSKPWGLGQEAPLTQVQANDTKEMKDALGPNPRGRLILTGNGFVTNYRVADGRKPAETDAERAQLLRTMAAWTGRYRVEENKLIVTTDSAWNEEGTGRELPRTFVIEGNRLTLTTVTPRSNFFEGRPATGNEYFERED